MTAPKVKPLPSYDTLGKEVRDYVRAKRRIRYRLKQLKAIRAWNRRGKS